MTGADEFQVRPGKIRSTRTRKARSFLAHALAATQKAGGFGTGSRSRRARFGRGRTATVMASRLLAARSRGAVIKARVVRQHRAPGALRAHVTYLQRDGVTRDGQPGRMFDAAGDTADPQAFAERCGGDRHHFRFIVSPDDAAELGDLRQFARELMERASHDLGTSLDWVAVDHWNTEHPHIHILVRGRADDGADLVVSRDYIGQGLRARAGALVTQELGPKSELEIRRGLEAEVTADRFTRLDRILVREAAAHDGIVDLRPLSSDPSRQLRIARMRELERLGLAEPAGSARWVLSHDVEGRLRDLGERGDLIKRLHRGLGSAGIVRATSDWSLAADGRDQPIIGRLIARGLDDELKGSSFAIIDGVDGRVHHVRLPTIEATGDGPIGAIVELRHYQDRGGRARSALAVRSDYDLQAQVSARGATWIDRQLVAREPVELARSGFGLEVRAAMEARVDQLVRGGLALREDDRVVFKTGLIEQLRRRDLAESGARLSREAGLAFTPMQDGDVVSGTYRRRITLTSGRFAMIDNGLGFALVPWSPALERNLNRRVGGVVGPERVEWNARRSRSASLSL